jgi:type II secretory pathway pseudopilin PulG
MRNARAQSGAFYRASHFEEGRAVFETLLVLILLCLLLFFALERYVISIGTTRETALMVELSNLRTAINFFVMAKKRLPLSLNELTREKAVVTGHVIEGKEYYLVIGSSYIQTMKNDEEGYPTDAFGNRFSFDPATGRLWSSTKGYETW